MNPEAKLWAETKRVAIVNEGAGDCHAVLDCMTNSLSLKNVAQLLEGELRY